MRYALTDEYLTGVGLIDAQHRTFVDIANEILDLLEDKTEAVTYLRAKMALDKLGNYALYHLSTEEDLFMRCRMSRYEEHLRAHESYRETIRQFLLKVHDNIAELEKPIAPIFMV